MNIQPASVDRYKVCVVPSSTSHPASTGAHHFTRFSPLSIIRAQWATELYWGRSVLPSNGGINSGEHSLTWD